MTATPSSAREAAVTWSPGRSVGVTVRGTTGPILVFAHGAGTDRHHPLVADQAARIAAAGIVVATFDYPYRAEGRRWPPDRSDVLLQAHRAVLDWSDLELGPRPVIGGRSMGGRIASILAAEGRVCAGLVFHAYPLHTARRPDRPRSAHLTDVGVPMLFVRGTADPMARPDLFDREIRTLEGVEVVDLEGVDHSFGGGAGGRESAMSAAADATIRFVLRVT